jgi:hypothetical protein
MALYGPRCGVKHTMLYRQPHCTGGRCRSLQIDFKQAQGLFGEQPTHPQSLL